MPPNHPDILIVGGGIGGLTLALALHARGIPCRVFEAVAEPKAIGVGINVLPHAAQELAQLGLEEALGRVGIATREASFFNRFGQLIHSEPLGRFAGYAHPQFSIHRGDLHKLLQDAALERLGAERIHLGWRCTGFTQDASGVTVAFDDMSSGAVRPPQRGSAAIACEGLHSVIRKQLHPGEGEPRYAGVNMWRGVTRMKPVLSGASMVRAGWLTHGKMVIYPIRQFDDGTQLMNWVAEIETPHYKKRDWNRPGSLDDFIGRFESWQFDWLDVPAMIRAADAVLEFPMIDQDPLPWWTQGRVTLLGDAAHPMVPRGSNGAGQSIIDARTLADCLAACLANGLAQGISTSAAHGAAAATGVERALKDYEAKRLQATSNVVLTNRSNPPDAIIRAVYERIGDKPFERIEDVISAAELTAITDGYKQVAGYTKEGLAAR